MKKLIKKLTLSLIVATTLCTSGFAMGEKMSQEEGKTRHMYDLAASLEDSQGNFQTFCIYKGIKEETAKSYLNIFGEYAYGGVKCVGKTAFDFGLSGAETLVRYGVAYYAAYAGVETLKEATAWGMYLAAYGLGTYTAGPIAGSTAGNTAYMMTKATFTAAQYVVPGLNGALAAAYMPAVKVATDTTINWTPKVLKTGYSVAKISASAMGAASSYIWSYFNGK